MTSLSDSRMFATGGGKSLYIKSIQPLRFSISAIAIIAVILFVNTENAYSQCPPGFIGPKTTTMHFGPDCRVEIEYCLSIPSPASGLCNIHISKQRYIGACYNYFPVDQNGNYGVSTEDIVTHITRLFENYSCFDMINLDTCPQASREVILVSNGGCYFFVEGLTLEGEFYRQYIPCVLNVVSYCYEYFSFCKKFINGKWEIQTISGPPAPQFECLDVNCTPYCF